MATRRRIRGKIRVRNLPAGDERNVETLSAMINASRAFRNLPPEVIMGEAYDRGQSKDPTYR